MKKFLPFFILILLYNCSYKNESLHPVTVAEFAQFVEETNYVTDAEKFGWSFVQKSIFDYDVVKHVNWKNPDSISNAQDNYPVTQVSYNDALAYANWAGVRLPTYKEYWMLAHKDRRPVNAHNTLILPTSQVNVIGNVWDITYNNGGSNVKLAGGSFLCDENTCNGTDISRRLFVDKETANSHVSFSVVIAEQ